MRMLKVKWLIIGLLLIKYTDKRNSFNNWSDDYLFFDLKVFDKFI